MKALIGIIVMTHGNFSSELVKSCELIAGPAEKVATLTLNRDDNIESLNEKFVQKLEELDEGDGILVLTDLLGGSPSNVASFNLKKGRKYESLTGVNLPMLLEAMVNRDNNSLEDLVHLCMEAGISGIKHINEMLS